MDREGRHERNRCTILILLEEHENHLAVCPRNIFHELMHEKYIGIGVGVGIDSSYRIPCCQLLLPALGFDTDTDPDPAKDAIVRKSTDKVI